MVDGQGRVAGWRSGEDREARDAALSAELARYMIRSEPLGMDRHHQRYWHMQVGRAHSDLGVCLVLVSLEGVS
jgi:hypothetical protein